MSEKKKRVEKKAKTDKQTKSEMQSHYMKKVNGQWGGTTYCGISFRRKKFLEKNIGASEQIVNCDKCIKNKKKAI